MKKLHLSWVTAAAVALLVACGGGGAGDQTPRVTYGKLVTFGDSLSDVGTYNAPGSIVAFYGGGRYTVNTGDPVNWTELLAATIGVDPLCPAQTGLNTIQAVLGFPPVPEVNHAGCFSYAQGGARVTDPVGPGNALLFSPDYPEGALGQLTKPIVEQIGRHLAIPEVGGHFAADDLVTVMAGGNDLFMNLSAYAVLQQTGAMTEPQAHAFVVAAMNQAGTELSGYVKDQIVANGATHVVVVNVPNASKAPAFLGTPSEGLVDELVNTFNAALVTGLEGTSDHVLLVDAYSVSTQQANDPAHFGLTNVTTPACDLTLVPTSLLCSTDTLIPGVTETYEYADTVHPTPYGYKLLAQLVIQELAKKGWL